MAPGRKGKQVSKTPVSRRVKAGDQQHQPQHPLSANGSDKDKACAEMKMTSKTSPAVVAALVTTSDEHARLLQPWVEGCDIATIPPRVEDLDQFSGATASGAVLVSPQCSQKLIHGMLILVEKFIDNLSISPLAVLVVAFKISISTEAKKLVSRHRLGKTLKLCVQSELPHLGESIWKFVAQLPHPKQQRGRWTPAGIGYVSAWGKPSKESMWIVADGATHICTLLSQSEDHASCEQYCNRHQLKWIYLPLDGANMAYLSQPSTLEAITRGVCQLIKLLAIPQDPPPAPSDEAAPTPHVLFHCAAGIHRTGTVIYTLLRCLGCDPFQARLRLYSCRPLTAHGVKDYRLNLGEDIAQKIIKLMRCQA